MIKTTRQNWQYLRSRYLPLVWILWGGCVAGLYFYRFPLPQLNADNPYPAFALSAWIGWVALMIGSLLLRRLKLQYRSSVEHMIFSWALGLALLGYSIFALGLAHILYSWLVYTVLIVLTIISAGEATFCLRILHHALLRPYHIAKFDVMLATILLGLLGLHLTGTLIPPMLFDALVYHLAVPKLYLLTHSIEYIPYSFFSNFPFLMEMLYTLGLALHGPLVANMLNYLIHLLMLASLYTLARTYCNHRIALMSVLIFYTVPWVGMESFLPYIDVGLALYVVLGLYALLNWISRKHSGWLLVCGICSGVGMSIKYLGMHNATVMCLSVVGWLLWRMSKRTGSPLSLSTAFREVLIFAVPMILCGAPWYLKSFFFTGNPIYPFVFGGGEWSSEMLRRYTSAYQMNFETFFQRILTFFKLPWELVFSLETSPNNIPIGPIFLVFLPLLLFVQRVTPFIKYLIAASVMLAVFWFYTSPQSRFLIPTLALLSIAAAYGIEQLAAELRTAWLKRIVYMLLTLMLLSNIGWELIYINSFFDPFEIIMGLESKHDYLNRLRSDIYPITQYANETLPAKAKILFIGDTRGYYAERPFIANTAHDKTPIVEMAHVAQTIDGLLDHLNELGVTHIVFNRREAARLYKGYTYLHWKTPEDERLFWTLYQTRLKQLKSINDSELLEILY